MAQHAASVAPCNGTLVIAGDSAGGNLTACICLELEAAARARVIGEVLIYPATDHYTVARPSYVEKATGQMLTTELMQWFWDRYLGARSAADPEVQRAFPMRADNLAGLPPTLLLTAENDPLRDDGITVSTVSIGDGAVVGTHFKVGGDTWSPVDGERVKRFMDRVSGLR